MNRLEQLLLPIFLLVAVVAWLLMKADISTVTMVGRIFGISLVALLVLGMIGRRAAKKRKARRGDEETWAKMHEMAESGELDEILSEAERYAAENPEPQDKKAEG